MNWTRPGDLRSQLRRAWERGELLRAVATSERPQAADLGRPPPEEAGRLASGPSFPCGPMFPLRLSLRGPRSAELAERFADVRDWIAELAGVRQIRIDWREVDHRVLGPQRLPRALWVDTLDDALTLIGKRGEATRFEALLALTGERQPALLTWLGKRPLQALELAADWQRLLAVVAWMQAHPRPQVYLRQVDVPGVHSKFIEAHRGALGELFDLALPAAAIDAGRGGAGRFAERYGFLDKPGRIRLRVLDAALALLPGAALPDVTLDADSFARLRAPIRRVFITENETNFLAFPLAADAIVIFGAGYGWETLGRAAWLTRCSLHYWGDIDTHGFAILDQLRSRFEHVESFLMDRDTLMAHQALWGEEVDQIVHDLPRLTDAERALFDELRDNRIRKGLRLEQERVGFERVRAALDDVIGASLARANMTCPEPSMPCAPQLDRTGP